MSGFQVDVNTANITNRKATAQALETNKDDLKKVATVLTDGGYTGENFANSIEESINAEVEVAKRSALHTLAVIPKCRLVERSFAWIEKC